MARCGTHHGDRPVAGQVNSSIARWGSRLPWCPAASLRATNICWVTDEAVTRQHQASADGGSEQSPAAPARIGQPPDHRSSPPRTAARTRRRLRVAEPVGPVARLLGGRDRAMVASVTSTVPTTSPYAPSRIKTVRRPRQEAEACAGPGPEVSQRLYQALTHSYVRRAPGADPDAMRKLIMIKGWRFLLVGLFAAVTWWRSTRATELHGRHDRDEPDHRDIYRDDDHRRRWNGRPRPTRHPRHKYPCRFRSRSASSGLVAALVVRDSDAIALLQEEHHLVVPVVRTQRPAVMKPGGGPSAPILVKYLWCRPSSS